MQGTNPDGPVIKLVLLSDSRIVRIRNNDDTSDT